MTHLAYIGGDRMVLRFERRGTVTVVATWQTTVIHYQTVVEGHRLPRPLGLVTSVALVRSRWMVGGLVRNIMTASGLTRCC